MSELSKKDSNSDVDSNSSWTLLSVDATKDDDRSTEKDSEQAEENVTTEPGKNENNPEIKENELVTKDVEKKSRHNQINRENDVESLSSSSTYSLDSLTEVKAQESGPEQGCPTLDEYLNDKELTHDYDYDERAETWEYLQSSKKQRKRKYKKYADENLTTITIVGAVISLAGLSLICMLSPLLSRQAVSTGLQNRIEKNFTNVETPYTTANNLKFYISKSDKGVQLIDKADTLNSYVEKCCKSHIKSIESEGMCSKYDKPGSQSTKIDRPVTYEQFLKEDLVTNKKRPESAVADIKEHSKPETVRNDKDAKMNEHKTILQSTSTNAEEKLKEDREKSTVKIAKSNISTTKKDKNSQGSLKKHEKEIKIKTAVDKKNHESKKKTSYKVDDYKIQDKLGLERKNKWIEDKSKMSNENKRKQDVKKGDVNIGKKEAVPSDAKQLSNITEQYNSLPDTLKKVQDTYVPNFVLVSKEVKKQGYAKNINTKHIKNVFPTLPTIITSNKQNILVPNKMTKVDNSNVIQEKKILPTQLRATQNANGKAAKNDCITCSKTASTASLPSSKQTSTSSNNHINFVACQLLQDLCMLRLTGKLRTKEKARERKLKRKVDRKKLGHTMKTAMDVIINEEVHQKKAKEESKTRTNIINDVEKGNGITFQKSMLNFKPKLVENHFINNFKRASTISRAKLSNLELLKELPFMTEKRKEIKECTAISTPQPKIFDEAFVQRIQHISFENLLANDERKKTIFPRSPQSDANLVKHQRFMTSNEIVNQKSAKFLEDTRRKNDERLKILEQMRKENRLKIDAIIRERKERLKKDAALGIYNVPLPKYTEISEKLKQLKKKRTQPSFVVDQVSSSDSEPEPKCPNGIENKISCELMTALRMGKKVSDTFREWTLKKAPTLTCLKNYCNSKVSQISERLTSQSMNQTNIKSTLDKEELQALKCRREKHEQLKKFWRAKQEYLDKRIEICELIKKKLSKDDNTAKTLSEQNVTQGVQILDCIINDVLKTVKSSKSHVENTCRVANEMQKSSRSVGSIVIKESEKEKKAGGRRIETYSASSNDLYNWLFEKRAMEIRRKDRGLWNITPPGHVERKKEVSKQDPSKGYHEKLIKKHN